MNRKLENPPFSNFEKGGFCLVLIAFVFIFVLLV